MRAFLGEYPFSITNMKVKTYYNTNAHLLKHFVMFLAIVIRIKDHSGYHCIYRPLRISAKIGSAKKISVNSATVIKTLYWSGLKKLAALIFLQYTMDTVICQGTLDISLLKWSAAEWNQADIQRLSRVCRGT